MSVIKHGLSCLMYYLSAYPFNSSKRMVTVKHLVYGEINRDLSINTIPPNLTITVFLSRNFWLIVVPRKFNVLKTKFALEAKLQE